QYSKLSSPRRLRPPVWRNRSEIQMACKTQFSSASDTAPPPWWRCWRSFRSELDNLHEYSQVSSRTSHRLHFPQLQSDACCGLPPYFSLCISYLSKVNRF